MKDEASADYAWRTKVYAWGVVALLIIAFMFAMIDRMILTLLVGPLKADFGLSDTQISLLHGLAFTLLYVIVGLPMGWLTDRYSRRAIAGCSIAAWSLMTMVCGVASNFAQLFWARMGVGIGEAGISPAANSLIPDYFPPSQVSLPLTLYSIGGTAGSGLALIFGGSIVDFVTRIGTIDIPLIGQIHGWQASFLIAGAPGLLLGAAFLFVKEPPRRGKQAVGGAPTPPIGSTLRLLRAQRAFLLPQFGAAAACALVILSVVAWMPTHLVRTFGYSSGEVGLRYGMAVALGGVAGVISSGAIADRLTRAGRRDAPILVALAWTLLGIVPTVVAPVVPNSLLALLLSGVSVFGFAAAIALAPVALPIVVPNEMRGQVYALYLLTISLLGYAIGPVVVALLTVRFFQDDAMVGWSMALVALVAGPLAAILWVASRRQFLTLIGDRPPD